MSFLNLRVFGLLFGFGFSSFGFGFAFGRSRRGSIVRLLLPLLLQTVCVASLHDEFLGLILVTLELFDEVVSGICFLDGCRGGAGGLFYHIAKSVEILEVGAAVFHRG